MSADASDRLIAAERCCWICRCVWRLCWVTAVVVLFVAVPLSKRVLM